MSNYSVTDEFLNNPNTSWYKIFQRIRKKSRILDIGCSSGNLGAELMARKHCTVIGVDINDEDVAIAKTRLADAFVANIETDDLSHLGKFDYIIFADVIEHLLDPATALRKLKPLLADKGTLIFSLPNMAHMSVRMALMAGRFTYGETGLLDKTHLHYYDQEEIRRVISEAGYNLDNLDWVHRDVPEDFLRARLKELGLEATPVFIEYSKQVDAAAYQYVGQASIATGPAKPHRRPSVSPPINDFEIFFDSLKKEYIERIKALEKERNRLKATRDKLEADLLRHQGSLSWRVTEPLRKIKGKLKRR